MIVVIDTNIWRKELFPGSNNSAALKYFISRYPATLGLPEILRLEIESQLKQFIRERVSSIAENQRQLRGVFGSLREAALPSDDEIQSFVHTYATSLDVSTIHSDFSEVRAKQAYLRVLDKESPFSNGQQFKDAMLWEECLAFARSETVSFATEDKIFFETRNGSALNRKLESEVQSLPNKVLIYPSLTELLSVLKTGEPPLSSTSLDNLRKIVLSSGVVNDFLRNNSLFVDEIESEDIRTFATETSNRLATNFWFSWKCNEVIEADRSRIVLSISGSSMFNVRTDEFINLTPSEVMLKYRDKNDEMQTSGLVFGSASIVMGHPETKHEIRFPLDVR